MLTFIFLNHQSPVISDDGAVLSDVTDCEITLLVKKTMDLADEL